MGREALAHRLDHRHRRIRLDRRQNREFSQCLVEGIRNYLEIWGGVFGHDWPWWLENLRRFL